MINVKEVCCIWYGCFSVNSFGEVIKNVQDIFLHIDFDRSRGRVVDLHSKVIMDFPSGCRYRVDVTIPFVGCI